MSASEGQFVWHELMTTDAAAAKAFYGAVVGWGAQAAPAPNTAYTLFTAAGGTPVAGLMDLPEAARRAGAPPHWIGHVAVAEVDAAAERARRLGGTVHLPPTDIPEVGRFTVVADPQGATIALFRPSRAWPDGAAPEQAMPGRVGWHELAATDREAAFAFYSALFGWQKAEAIEVGGPVGTYQLFAAGGRVVGGLFTRPAAMPGPFWLYYVNTADIDAAAGRVREGGGQILFGPVQVPGGDWILQYTDPQGAVAALVGKRGQPPGTA